MSYPQWTQNEATEAFTVGRLVQVVSRGRGASEPEVAQEAPILMVEDDELLLGWPAGQTPLPALGTSLEISLLRQEPEGNRRYGYQTTVIDILDGPEWRDGMVGLMAMLPRARDLEPVNMHNGDRYRLADRRALGFYVSGLGSVVPMDLSLHRLRFRYPLNGNTLSMGQALDLDLMIHETSYQVSGQVVDVSEKGEWEEVSVKLQTLPLDVRAALADMLHRMEPAGPLDGAPHLPV